MQASKNAVGNAKESLANMNASSKAGMEKTQATLDGKVCLFLLSFSFAWKIIVFNYNNGINDMWLCMHADGNHESP